MEAIEREQTAKTEAAPRKIRCGRPPAERAGEVEGRILDAAYKVFLERGFEGATIDLIAETARSGKPTIYARFPNKEALFEATLTRSIRQRYARVKAHGLAGATIEERLFDIAVAILDETLTEDYVGIVRVAIGEARRIPELVRNVIQMAREHSGQIVAQMLAEVTRCETFANLRPGARRPLCAGGALFPRSGAAAAAHARLVGREGAGSARRNRNPRPPEGRILPRRLRTRRDPLIRFPQDWFAIRGNSWRENPSIREGIFAPMECEFRMVHSEFA